MKYFVTLFAVVAGLSLVGTASAADFKNGNLVAAKVEARYNSPSYKAGLAKKGGRYTKRTLCAYTGYDVKCIQYVKLSSSDIPSEFRGKELKITSSLIKTSATRGTLDIYAYFNGKMVDSDNDIVASTKIGLRSW